LSKIIAKLDDVTMRYGDKVILQNCSLDVVEGAITCIIGLSGAGKSTILRLLNGLRKPDEGHVYVKGVDICHMPETKLINFRRVCISVRRTLRFNDHWRERLAAAARAF